MGAGNLSEPPVAVEVVFERFPASVRGAVVVRGADADPHQARFASGTVADLRPNRSPGDLPLGLVTIDVAPRGEVLVPFDLPFAGLDPGWYTVTVEVEVDGGTRVASPGRRFLVPWPREEVRRGSVPVDGRIKVPGSPGAAVERVECKADRAIVRWQDEPGETPRFGDLRVLADGRTLPTLEGTHDEATGHRATVVYPVLKSHRSLELVIDRRAGTRSTKRGRWALEVVLP